MRKYQICQFSSYTLVVMCLGLLLLGVPLNAQEEPTFNRFGVVEGFWLPDVVCELGAGWERIIFDWAQHQPTGPDDWNTLNVDERWLSAAQDCNREVVAIVKHTPAWATDGLPGPGLPRGLYLPVEDPANTWAQFMRKAAEFYTPRGVSRYIIWNEPDIERGTYGFEFEGTLDDYLQMVKVAHAVVKSVNPTGHIHLAATTYWHEVNAGKRLYLDRLLERLMQDPEAAANDYYFDVMGLHIYFRTETVYDIVTEMRGILEKYGLGHKALWINEMNAAPTDDPLWPVVRPQYQINLAQQSAFIAQATALGLAAGVERLAVYKFFDWSLPTGGEAFGLLRADASRRPAFDTWQMIIDEWADVTGATFAEDDRVDVVQLLHPDRQTLVAWSKTADTAQVVVRATAGEARLFDQYGNEQPLQAVNGEFRLDLPGARCDRADGCAVGGDVAILVLPPGEITVTELRAGQQFELAFEQES